MSDNSAKFSVRAAVVLHETERWAQFTISVARRGKVFKTMMITEHEDEDVRPEIGRWLLSILAEELIVQRAVHTTSIEHPFQEELPF